MSSVKVFIFIIGMLSSFFGSKQISLANTVDYSSVDIGALQNQYQRQLKPKTPTPSKVVTNSRVVTKKQLTKHRPIKNKELLQYQQLLGLSKKAKSQPVKRQTAKPIRQVQRQVQPKRPAQRQQNNQQRNQRKMATVTQATRTAAPSRDAIFEAASNGNVRLIGQLISQGINVNQANNERETSLHMAAAKGHYSAVIYLLNHGANINSRTINNWLPIHHATRFRHAQIANYLKQKGSPIYAKTSDGLSAVDMAKALNDRRILGIFGVK